MKDFEKYMPAFDDALDYFNEPITFNGVKYPYSYVYKKTAPNDYAMELEDFIREVKEIEEGEEE